VGGTLVLKLFFQSADAESFVQLDMIEEVFNLFDTDGQQQLDEEELASAIFALGFSQNGHLEVLANFKFIASLQHSNHIPIFHSIITRKIIPHCCKISAFQQLFSSL
jgi:Ca2+-binding EF-hand superfamily protein